jgi:acetyl-CoA carboxylase biotin carboxyl carrier protein
MAQTRRTTRKGKSKAKASRAGARKTATATETVQDGESASTGRKRALAGKRAGSGSAGEHPGVALVRGLAEIVEAHSLSELVYDSAEITVTLRRAQEGSAAVVQHAVPVMAAPPAVAPSAPIAAVPGPPEPAGHAQEPPAEDQHHVVTSPFVGTFYRRPNPDADPYVKPGDRVEKGQVLCIVEAMKLMNEIEADATGTVVEILVEDGDPVQYGQHLFKIATA